MIKREKEKKTIKDKVFTSSKRTRGRDKFFCESVS